MHDSSAGVAFDPSDSAASLNPASCSASAGAFPATSAWQQLSNPMDLDDKSMVLLQADAAMGGGQAQAAQPLFDEVARQIPGNQDRSYFQLSSFMRKLQNRSFCEQALDMQPLPSGKQSIVVRPGFEGEFRSRVQAYITGRSDGMMMMGDEGPSIFMEGL